MEARFCLRKYSGPVCSSLSVIDVFARFLQLINFMLIPGESVVSTSVPINKILDPNQHQFLRLKRV